MVLFRVTSPEVAEKAILKGRIHVQPIRDNYKINSLPPPGCGGGVLVILQRMHRTINSLFDLNQCIPGFDSRTLVLVTFIYSFWPLPGSGGHVKALVPRLTGREDLPILTLS